MEVSISEKEKEVLIKLNDLLKEANGGKWVVITKLGTSMGLCFIIETLCEENLINGKLLNTKLFKIAASRSEGLLSQGGFWFTCFEQRRDFITFVLSEYC